MELTAGARREVTALEPLRRKEEREAHAGLFILAVNLLSQKWSRPLEPT